MAVTLGLIVTILGADPILGAPRLTLGIDAIEGGIQFLPVLIGVFAFAQVMTEVEKMGGAAQAGEAVVRAGRLAAAQFKVIWEILSRPFLLLWVAFIGVLIGVLPAIGGSAASVMAYDQAKKFSRHPERFGKGTPEGIIASEASNNANVGGSLVTIMAFGIPGDAVRRQDARACAGKVRRPYPPAMSRYEQFQQYRTKMNCRIMGRSAAARPRSGGTSQRSTPASATPTR